MSPPRFLSFKWRQKEADRTEATCVHSSAAVGRSDLTRAHFVLIFFGKHQQMTPDLSLCRSARCGAEHVEAVFSARGAVK